MPVIHVRASQPAGPVVDEVLREVAGASAEVLGGSPDQTWTTYDALARQAIGVDVDPAHPIVYVDVWVRSRGAATDQQLLATVCRVVADGLNVPADDVWGTLTLVRDGHVFAGGQIVGDAG